MNRVIHHNRWLIWAIVFCLVVALLTLAYIEFEKGEIDQETAYLLN